MNLFNNESDPTTNLLPKDGKVNYYGKLFSHQQALYYYNNLLNNINWKNDEAIIFGKLIITKRKVAWYGDIAFEYTYSNTTKKALPWTTDLLALKLIVEKKTGETYNSCLLNLYHNGSEGMAWHSDAEKDLKKTNNDKADLLKDKERIEKKIVESNSTVDKASKSLDAESAKLESLKASLGK